MESAFLSSPEEALAHFDVLEQNGLSDEQVQKNLEKYGRNGTVCLYLLVGKSSHLSCSAARRSRNTVMGTRS